MKVRSVLVFLLAIPFSLFSQDFRGTINGVVTDSTGGSVVGAKIVVKETHTNTATPTVSDSAGQYTAPFLLPGDYDISAQMSGFKEFTHKGVHVGAGDNIRVDIRLDIGATTESVVVTADVSAINSSSATIGQTITSKEVENLPLNGRTPVVLASLSMGVLATGQPSLIHPFDLGGAAGWSIAGTPAQVNELLIDGSPDATWDGRLAYSPQMDAVQEVVVKAFDTDAAFGHTGGGTINVILKSGTNQLHGSLWEFNQPNNLIADNFFTNRDSLPNPALHYNQYGLQVGGPIIIPKVYHGKDKLFWLFSWEGLKDAQPISPYPTYISVPTAAMRTGDFSALSTPIYNPLTAAANTGSGLVYTRQQFPGNIIPAADLSPIAQAYLKMVPLPNQPGGYGPSDYASVTPTTDNYNNYLGRMDFNATDRDRIFFDIRNTGYLQAKNDYFGNGITASWLTRNNWGGTVDNVYTINPTNVLDMRINFTRMNETHPSPTAGFDATSLGYPSYLQGLSPYQQLPSISFASTTSNTSYALGQTAASLLPSQSVQLFGTWSSIHGNHSLRFGFDLRQYVANFTNFGNSDGNFSFSANSWVKGPSANASSTVAEGQDIAELLLGLPTSGTYDLNTQSSFFEHYMGYFAQDDWRIRRNVTVNLGLRFDYDFPYHEKYGQVVDGFNTSAVSPIAGAAQLAYDKNPSTLLPASQFDVNGGLTFPSNGAYYNQTSHLFSPRVGVAWTPDLLKGKTVIRAGFAMFVQPIAISQLTITGAYSTSPILDQYGFSQTTTMTVSNNSFLSPANTLANPFPNGLTAPTKNTLGLAANLGASTDFIDPEIKDPYSVRWNLDIQHSITPTLTLEVAYVGNHGVHLPIYVTQLNSIPRQFLSTLPVRDNTTITALSATSPNPFLGLIPGQSLGTSSTEAASQILAKYPEFPTGTGSFSSGVIMQNYTAGDSFYDSLNVRLEKRYSNGLNIIGNYIYSKLIEQVTWLNDTDLQAERRISPYDHPQRMVLAAVYDIPVGKGRKLNISNPILDGFVGGWSLNSVYTFQIGAPITWTNGSTTSPGDYVYLGGDLQLNNQQAGKTAAGVAISAFNTSLFLPAAAYSNAAEVGTTCNKTPTLANCALSDHIRTFSTTFPNLRQDGIDEWDPSISKSFFFHSESRYLQIRGEFYNVLNHPNFAAPSTTATNAAFGTITAQANLPRRIQIGARFVF
jgi:hypothetical protein